MALDLFGVRVPEDLGDNAHRKKDAKLEYPAVAGANRRSPDPPVRRRRTGCGACRAEGGDEHGRERIRRCVTERAQETTPGSAASVPEMPACSGGFGLSAAPPRSAPGCRCAAGRGC